MTPYVHPQAKALLEQIIALASPKLNTLAVEQARFVYEGMKGLLERPAPAVALRQDVFLEGGAGMIGGRVYNPRPEDHAPRPVFLYFHGGGWVIGSLDTHDSLCATLATELDMTLVAVDYRLAPEHPFPAFCDDALAAARFMLTSPAFLGHRVNGIVVGGDSAGGQLAAIVAQAYRHKPQLLAQLLLYPATDMTAKTGSMQEFREGFLLEQAQMDWFINYAVPDVAQRQTALASPLFGEVAGVAPAVILTCGLDPLRDQGRAYGAMLIEAGVDVHYYEVPGLVHGCFNIRNALPAAHTALLVGLEALKHKIARGIA
jgi:acetyl esterase